MCWIEQGMDYLRMNPYSAGVKRGPKVELTGEQTKRRSLLLRKYAVYKSRLNHIPANYSVAEKVLAEIRLECQMASIVLETAQVGGVPKRWLEQMVAGR